MSSLLGLQLGAPYSSSQLFRKWPQTHQAQPDRLFGSDGATALTGQDIDPSIKQIIDVILGDAHRLELGVVPGGLFQTSDAAKDDQHTVERWAVRQGRAFQRVTQGRTSLRRPYREVVASVEGTLREHVRQAVALPHRVPPVVALFFPGSAGRNRFGRRGMLIVQPQRDARTGRDLLGDLQVLWESYVDQCPATAGPGRGMAGDAFAVLAPFVGAQVVRHVETRQRPRRAQVGVHGEQGLSQVRWCLEIRKNVRQEVVRVGKGSVLAFPYFRPSALCGGVFIVKDDDLVDAEYRQGTSYLTCQESLLFVGFGVGYDASWERDRERVRPATGRLEDGCRFGGVDHCAVFSIVAQFPFLLLDFAICVFPTLGR